MTEPTIEWTEIRSPDSQPHWRRPLPDGDWLIVDKPSGHRHWQWAHHRASGNRHKHVDGYHFARRARESADAYAASLGARPR